MAHAEEGPKEPGPSAGPSGQVGSGTEQQSSTAVWVKPLPLGACSPAGEPTPFPSNTGTPGQGTGLCILTSSRASPHTVKFENCSDTFITGVPLVCSFHRPARLQRESWSTSSPGQSLSWLQPSCALPARARGTFTKDFDWFVWLFPIFFF